MLNAKRDYDWSYLFEIRQLKLFMTNWKEISEIPLIDRQQFVDHYELDCRKISYKPNIKKE